MSRTILYLHGKGGNAAEAEHYKPLFPECDVIGLDYRAETLWEAKRELSAAFDNARKAAERVDLIANSLGALFAMHALGDRPVERAYFISPVVDMERIILNMMQAVGVTEAELREKQTVSTPFGETLSWDVLCYVRAHPLEWHAPTHIFYGGRDTLTDFQTVSSFAAAVGATLDVLSGGEHWFHTAEQMAFLDERIRHYES